MAVSESMRGQLSFRSFLAFVIETESECSFGSRHVNMTSRSSATIMASNKAVHANEAIGAPCEMSKTFMPAKTRKLPF